MSKPNRNQEISDALVKLEAFRNDPAYKKDSYAIEENICFLEAIQTIPSYIKWLVTRAKKLDGSRLLELTDFPVEDWDISIHQKLIEMPTEDKPGLIKPLVNSLFD